MLFYQQFNWIDYLFFAVMIISMIFGYRRGFIREIISLVVWFVALALPTFLGPVIAPHLSGFSENPSIQIGVAFLGIFVIVFIIGLVINFIARKAIDKTGLSGADRFIGVIFGLFRGIAILAVVVSFVNLTVLSTRDSWNQSFLVPKYENAIQNVLSLFPSYQDNAVKKQQASNQAQARTLL